MSLLFLCAWFITLIVSSTLGLFCCTELWFTGASAEHVCFLFSQDVTCIDYDMEKLTLQIPKEDGPRTLECRLLEPGESRQSEPMTPEQLKDIFVGTSRANNAEVDEAAEEVESVPDLDDINDQQIEAMNLFPEDPVQPGDGDVADGETGLAFGDVAETQLVELDELESQVPDGLFGPATDAIAEITAAFADEDLDDYVVVEELQYEPSAIHAPAPGSPGLARRFVLLLYTILYSLYHFVFALLFAVDFMVFWVCWMFTFWTYVEFYYVSSTILEEFHSLDSLRLRPRPCKCFCWVCQRHLCRWITRSWSDTFWRTCHDSTICWCQVTAQKASKFSKPVSWMAGLD